MARRATCQASILCAQQHSPAFAIHWHDELAIGDGELGVRSGIDEARAIRDVGEMERGGSGFAGRACVNHDHGFTFSMLCLPLEARQQPIER